VRAGLVHVDDARKLGGTELRCIGGVHETGASCTDNGEPEARHAATSSATAVSRR
jgi:hypothetical protein